MTATLHSPPAEFDHDSDFDHKPEGAYEEFWHATEDDLCATDFDADDRSEDLDPDDVYFAFVSSIEA